MKSIPIDIGTVHFIGIGGIGMSGIAEVMHNLGYKVQGSDLLGNSNVERLTDLGIKVFIGHSEKNIIDAKVVVCSSAIQKDNIEIKNAHDLMIPIVRRSEMLAELMRLKWSIAVGGSHGKTTTTSLISAVLDEAELDPTVINGGIINAYGTNARLGDGDWMVVEADESDGTFNRLPATIAVVTNIDHEHLDFYGDFKSLKKAFKKFIDSIPFYGFAALCIDNSEVRSLIPEIHDRKVITYGFSPEADVCVENISTTSEGTNFDISISTRVRGSIKKIKNLMMPMIGHHNVINATSAVLVGLELGVNEKTIRNSLSSFSGVKRRFTKIGEVNEIKIFDDYGHHPVEISAVLSAAKIAAENNVIAVVQPHRFTRLSSLFMEFCKCFEDADHVIVADVYAAGETPIEGFDKSSLVEGLRDNGCKAVTSLSSPEELPELIYNISSCGDWVVFLGAGNITSWAASLPCQLQELYKKYSKEF